MVWMRTIDSAVIYTFKVKLLLLIIFYSVFDLPVLEWYIPLFDYLILGVVWYVVYESGR